MTLKIGLVLACLLGLVGPAFACEKYADVVQDAQGTVVRNVLVTVKGAGSLTPATIYSEKTCTTPQTNPMTTDTEGIFSFYAPNGRYDLTMLKAGLTFSNVFTADILLFDPDDFVGGGGGVSSFADLLSGTNTTSAMIVGSGSSVTFTGSGSLNASLFRGLSTLSIGVGGTGHTTALDDTVLIGTGTDYGAATLPNCTTGKLLYDAATNLFSCGVDSATFTTLGSGTNTTAAMEVGSGATLTYGGSGTLNASSFRGNSLIAVVDGGTNLTVATDDTVMVGNGTTWIAASLPSCSHATNSKLLYDNTANVFSCGTDQSAGGGTTFDTIGSGTNTTAAMVLGTGSSLAVTGTGTATATTLWPNLVTVNAGNSPYTALTSNEMLLCDTTLASRIVNLPAATVKVLLTVFNLGANPCTINRAGSDTINTGLTSSSSFVLRNAGSSFWLQPDGTSTWYVGG
jgi:fibronectin-binding autotransporter adhesin